NNLVGLAFPTSSGQLAMGNTSDGVFLDTAAGVASGGGPPQPVSVTDNVISANRGDGLRLLDSKYVAVTGNTIGIGNTAASTSSSFGNAGNGITLNVSASSVLAGNNTIGGMTQSERNIVSNNRASGIVVFGTTTPSAQNNLVVGNYIGVDASGSQA